MNVLLVQPPRLPGLKETRGGVPLSLLYLASALRSQGHNPHILDLSIIETPKDEYIRKDFFGELCAEKIEEINANLVGISCFTTMHFPTVAYVAELIKDRTPSIKICLGGAHPTYFGEDILKNCNFVDFVVDGEGEEALVGLANHLEKQSRSNNQS